MATPRLVHAFDQILDYDFKSVVGGHLSQLATRDDVIAQRDYVRDLMTAAGTANQQVDYESATSNVDPQNVWAQFKTYSDAVTARCIQLMPDWTTRLGGADVFLPENCFVATESQRID